MKNYELMLIFNPSLDDKAIDEEISKISLIIEKSQGTVQKNDIWGVKKLAYPIKHQENGFYALLYFSSGKDVLLEIDRLNKINDKILRHLIVRADGKN